MTSNAALTEATSAVFVTVNEGAAAVTVKFNVVDWYGPKALWLDWIRIECAPTVVAGGITTLLLTVNVWFVPPADSSKKLVPLSSNVTPSKKNRHEVVTSWPAWKTPYMKFTFIVPPAAIVVGEMEAEGNPWLPCACTFSVNPLNWMRKARTNISSLLKKSVLLIGRIISHFLNWWEFW